MMTRGHWSGLNTRWISSKAKELDRFTLSSSTSRASIDSEVEQKSSRIHAIAPKNQQVNFDSHKKFEKQELKCPICEIILLLSEGGTSAHVEDC